MKEQNDNQKIEDEIEKVNSLVKSSRELRAKLLKDPYRPGYHIVTPEGLCAPYDPNGAIFWKGKYHLFYILQNEKGHCWGHISSKDLVHWRHHPVALAPEPGDVDTGIFSGGAFIDRNGIPTITYQGLGEKAGICIAISTDDDLDYWTKSPHNPVIPYTKPGDPGHGVYDVVDPSACWFHNDRYYVITGNIQLLRSPEFEELRKSKKPEELGDTVYLFESDDLIHWKYLHPFYKSDRKWTKDFEDDMCPDFFPLGDKHILLFISHPLGCQYYIGCYENDYFYPETHGRMTWVDNAFFAPESLLDDKGRRILWAWIFDGRKDETRKASGWSGTMSLPRVLWLGEDKTLRMRPPDELEMLRYNPKKMDKLLISNGSELSLNDIHGNSLELNIEMIPNGGQQFGVKVCYSPDGEEQTAIFYDAIDNKLKVDTTKSSLDEGSKLVEEGPFKLKPNESLKLQIFVDKSVVEVFANDRQAVMRNIYPTRKDSQGVSLFSIGGSTRVESIEAWTMAPANPW